MKRESKKHYLNIKIIEWSTVDLFCGVKLEYKKIRNIDKNEKKKGKKKKIKYLFRYISYFLFLELKTPI